jgi:hypothetical protein
MTINLETIFPWMNKWQVRFQSPPRCGRTRLIQTDPVRYALEERLPGGGVFDRLRPAVVDHLIRHTMVGEPGVWRRPGDNSGPLIQAAEISSNFHPREFHRDQAVAICIACAYDGPT